MVDSKPIIVSIIIVNYNTGKILFKCVDSILRIENSDLYEIIIIDQNSSDESKEIILSFVKKYNNIKHIFNDSNTGFAKGVNEGFKIAKGKYLIILNPDVIFKEALIEKYISIFKENKIGAISPLLINPNGNIQYEYYQKYPSISQFFFFHSIFAKLFKKSDRLRRKFHYDETILKDKKGLIKVVQLPCAFLFIPREIFCEHGKMNDKYFLFFEDMDLSYRINKNYNLFVDCDASVIHLGGASFDIKNNPEIFGYYILSFITFFEQNYNFFYTILIKIFTLTNSLIIYISERLKQLIKKQNKFRLEKHRFFIKLFIQNKL
ncbi:MAG: glycosyltransferase [Ignavibacteria bacterium]|nr:glycosyltransferase [Ignavibacteria bacterium]